MAVYDGCNSTAHSSLIWGLAAMVIEIFCNGVAKSVEQVQEPGGGGPIDADHEQLTWADGLTAVLYEERGKYFHWRQKIVPLIFSTLVIDSFCCVPSAPWTGEAPPRMAEPHERLRSSLHAPSRINDACVWASMQ